MAFIYKEDMNSFLLDHDNSGRWEWSFLAEKLASPIGEKT